MTRPYHPISCAVHDRLLELATLRRECEIGIVGDRSPDRVRGVIVDVYSQGGAEYLRLRDGTTLRLDEIRDLDGEPVPPA